MSTSFQSRLFLFSPRALLQFIIRQKLVRISFFKDNEQSQLKQRLLYELNNIISSVSDFY